MKKIPLSKEAIKHKNYFALVDDEDYEYLMQWRWHVHFIKKKSQKYALIYAVRHSKYINRKRTTIKMHHEIIGKPPKGMLTDHRDGDGLNNQRKNIWHCTPSQNTLNLRRPRRDWVSGKKEIIIVQKDINGQILNIFPSMREASLITGANMSSISQQVNNKKYFKSVKGFVFSRYQ